MSKKTVNEYQIRENAKIEIERNVLAAENLELKRIIAEGRAKPLEAVAAPPVAAPPVQSVAQKYRAMRETNPYLAAEYLLNNEAEYRAAAAAERIK